MKIRKTKLADFIYMIGIYFVLRVSPLNAADLLEKWVIGLRRDWDY